VEIVNPLIRITNNLDPVGDERIKITGFLRIPEANPIVDPLGNGFAFALVDPETLAPIFTRAVPGGTGSRTVPGWQVNLGRTRWVYTDLSASAAPGVKRIVVARRGTDGYRFSVFGRDADFQIKPGRPPIRLLVVLGGSDQTALGQCGGATFHPETGPRPRCKFTRNAAVLTCR
jgi:hypothetical protein